ncbi:RNA polymerase sigma factor [Sunxiuqinia sp. A32]|uniref:RNA polymerase sigma factor n=1 Tax=Sunxiuqinia sp. A32 TaxID=3461496 RepID=UPI004045AFE3
MPKSDLIIWNKFKNGDDFCLSLIYSEHVKSLYIYGLKFTTNSDLVEDAIQDLFLDLIKNRKTIGTTDNIQFYLIKSFRRKLIRRLKRELRYSDNKIDDFFFELNYSLETNLIQEETLNNKKRRLTEAIKKLSPRQKEAIYLKFEKDLDYKEISEILGTGIEGARNLIYRSIKSLKKLFKQDSISSVLLHIFKNSSNFFEKNLI